jgi:outer membrane lipoprotein-sorting protein
MKTVLVILSMCCGGLCLAQAEGPKATAVADPPVACASAPVPAVPPVISNPQSPTLEGVLEALKKQTESLGSYQAKVKYLFIQDPELLDSRTLRTGSLYYQKSPKSQIRIQFDTFKQEATKEEKRLEQFFFDGVWLTRIDHTLKKADLYQKAKPDKPLNVFEFLNTSFPIVGFAKTENLSKDFTISLAAETRTDPNQPVHLLLVTKPESRFAEQYKKIDFWIDARQVLPKRILTASTEGDIYDISFVDAVVNKAIDPAVFVATIPDGFTQNKQLLDENNPDTTMIVPQVSK